jgi:hypothetical protein
MITDPADRTNAAMLGMQKELLDAFEQASRARLSRVKSDMELWSEPATKLSTTKAVPAALRIYQKYVTQANTNDRRGWAAALRRVSKITHKITWLMSSGWLTGNA